ncbi:MAG: hypothetical protein IPL86_13185 [Flavobacteriales bacterium]|nr:hypothetical protein [Flavobacteriales bacterium]
MKLYQDLVIRSGAKLTVKCELQFVPGTKVIVEPGAQLIIDGGMLTNDVYYDSFWTGIEVWGDNTQNQWGATVDGTYRDFAHQGYVELRNGGTIEHARNAIAMKQGTTYGTFGGVVRSYGGVFKNNRRAVEFLKYQNTIGASAHPVSNRSFFHNTTFTVDDHYRGGDDFHNHVSMWEVSGVTFSGCKFENAQTSITESHKLGYGIGTLDAKFTVKARCLAPGPQPNPCPEIWKVPSEFIGLDHAIHATQSFMTTNTFHVENTEFTNNVCGIYSEGVLGFKVLDNKFEVGGRDVDLTNPIEFPNWDGFHRTIYSTQGYGFLIEGNSFWKVGPEPSEGLVIDTPVATTTWSFTTMPTTWMRAL